MKEVIVTREVLELYDKYEQDFGLLAERWACKKDREKVTSEQMTLLEEYVDKLNCSKVKRLSLELKNSTLERITKLEKVIDRDVIETLRKRAQMK